MLTPNTPNNQAPVPPSTDEIPMEILIPRPNAPDTLFWELWQKCSLRIGRGTMRDVYEIPKLELVLKVSTGLSYIQNWTEIVTYSRATDKTLLAEVVSWSMSGKFLVMERLTPAKDLTEIASFKFPKIANDKKSQNVGTTKDGQFKMLDYGIVDIDTAQLSPSYKDIGLG